MTGYAGPAAIDIGRTRFGFSDRISNLFRRFELNFEFRSSAAFPRGRNTTFIPLRLAQEREEFRSSIGGVYPISAHCFTGGSEELEAL
jgi:hypothetical protein